MENKIHIDCFVCDLILSITFCVVQIASKCNRNEVQNIWNGHISGVARVALICSFCPSILYEKRVSLNSKKSILLRLSHWNETWMIRIWMTHAKIYFWNNFVSLRQNLICLIHIVSSFNFFFSQWSWSDIENALRIHSLSMTID